MTELVLKKKYPKKGVRDGAPSGITPHHLLRLCDDKETYLVGRWQAGEYFDEMVSGTRCLVNLEEVKNLKIEAIVEDIDNLCGSMKLHDLLGGQKIFGKMN